MPPLGVRAGIVPELAEGCPKWWKARLLTELSALANPRTLTPDFRAVGAYQIYGAVVLIASSNPYSSASRASR
jgi:hypothetical protein